MEQLIIGCVISFLVCFYAIPVIITVANKKKLYDIPDERKIHTTPISSLGGLGIFVGFMLGLLLAINSVNGINGFQYFIASFMVIFFFGIKDDITMWSNPETAQQKAFKYLGQDAELYRSDKKDKKYKIFDGNKWVHFGQIKFQDFTKHEDDIRRKNYLTRTANMRGEWKSNKYSANNLSRNILW
jgi:UDP-N-acetylmuramyl pentapeptide phosphotransferase/UDP-N-acetylglucosamine-1-phosphate transferase